ncbi:MAG: cohesin domain-containing protein [Dehalococcoidales bacterium]|nr:cohesin domain-containing protein [Dehalococcoidales bacterium]
MKNIFIDTAKTKNRPRSLQSSITYSTFRQNHFRIIVLLLAAILALGHPGTLFAADITGVTVSAPENTIEHGGSFTINIDIDPAVSIAGAQFSISFDPDLVTAQSVTEGNLLKQNGANTFFYHGTIDNDLGKISDIFGVIMSPGNTVSTSGTIAAIQMTAKSNGGISTITLSDVDVGDINGQSIPVNLINGTVMINQAPVLAAIGNKSVQEGKRLAFTISAQDADGDPLTYSASNLPPGASFDASKRIFSWTPDSGQAGLFQEICFEVTDGSQVDSENINIIVNKKPASRRSSVSRPPAATAPPGFVDSKGMFKQDVIALSKDSLVEMVVRQDTEVAAFEEQVLDQIAIVDLPQDRDLPEQIIKIGQNYSIEPGGIMIDPPADLTIRYEQSQIPEGVNINDLKIATWDDPTGELVELDSVINTYSQTIQTKVSTFSSYFIVAHISPADDSSIISSDQGLLEDNSSEEAVTDYNWAASVPAPPVNPEDKEFSLSLLAKLIGGAFVFILIVTGIVFIYRKKMSNGEYSQ